MQRGSSARASAQCSGTRPLQLKQVIKKRAADRYIKNKTKILEKQSEYRAQNKEKIKQRKAKYRSKNKEKIKQWHAKDYNHNKERYKQQGQDYRSKRSNKQPACVYQIKNLTNNKTYIGQTTRGELRWLDHLRNLRGNRHPNSKLQQHFNEHEEGAFEWSIIKELPKDKEKLLLEEAREIQRRINNGENLYNLMLTIEQLKLLNENKEER